MDDKATIAKAELSSLIESSPSKTEDFRLISKIESVDEFKNRLKTFRRWTSKPNDVSPWWCSRFGWVCIEKDLLQCIECRQYLSAHLPSTVEESDMYKKSVSRLRGLLIEGHANSCKRRSLATDEANCAPNLGDCDSAFAEFYERLLSLGEFFPSDENERKYSVSSAGFFEKMTEAELDELSTSVDVRASREAGIVACLGWNVDRSCKECISCDYCLRRIGLWMFRSPTSNSNGDNLENDRKLCVKPAKIFDPLDQHHKWCPWLMTTVSSDSINDSDGVEISSTIPTWIAYLRLILTRIRTTAVYDEMPDGNDPLEQYMIARQLLEPLEYLEPEPEENTFDLNKTVESEEL